MTNFEKWKAGQTPSSMAIIFSTGDTCSYCPAFSICDAYDKDIHSKKTCSETFEEWAIQELYPDGPYCTGCNHIVYRNGCEYCKRFKVYLHGACSETMERCDECKMEARKA